MALTEEEEDAIFQEGGVERFIQLARIGITRSTHDVALPMGDFDSGIYEFDAAEAGSTSSGLQLRGPKAALAQPPAAVGGSSRSHAPRPTGTTAPAADTRAPPSAPLASADTAIVLDSKAVLKNLPPSIFRLCV